MASPAMTDEDAPRQAVITSILYAIAQLAVDTESNASRIVALEERLDDLEEALAARFDAGR